MAEREHEPKGYQRVAQGVDTLIVNGAGTFFDGVPEFLDAMQQDAIAGRDMSTRRTDRERVRSDSGWVIDGQPLLIKPHGGGRGMWRWILECPALTLEVGHGELNGIMLRARLSSAFLWQHGYRQAWEMTEEVLNQFGDFTYQPSEVHLAVDVAGKALASLQEYAFRRKGHVVRWHLEDAQILDLPPSEGYLRDRALHDVILRYRQAETLSFSLTAPHSCAIYDKPREIRIKSRDKLWFADIWRANGWDGLAPIIRVEMRYERAMLHEFAHAPRCPDFDQCGDPECLAIRCHDPDCRLVHGFATMAELFAGLDGLWRYSTSVWLRHTTPTKDKNRARWPTSPWWQVVQDATFDRLDATPLVRDRQHAFHKDRILSTMYGYLESLTAWMTAAQELPLGATVDDALVELQKHAETHYERRGSAFRVEVESKLKKIGIAV